MGADREEISFWLLVVRNVLVLALTFAAGLFLPWFITVALAAAFLLLKFVSFEIILVGAVLDILILSPDDGLRGIFFALIFLGLSLAVRVFYVLFPRYG